MPRPHPLLNIKKQNGDGNGVNEHRGGWKELEIVEDDPITGQRLHKSLPRDDDQDSIIRFVQTKVIYLMVI